MRSQPLRSARRRLTPAPRAEPGRERGAEKARPPGGALSTTPPHRTDPAGKRRPPHHPRRFPDDAPVHLRDPGATVMEHDRDLADAEALPPALERHLDLE